MRYRLPAAALALLVAACGASPSAGPFVGLITSGSDVDEDVSTVFKEHIRELEWTN